jgi:2-polyprenyl-3-methyl-5-hydroxy-6-metoxy-1,4-benzoquinol methylase
MEQLDQAQERLKAKLLGLNLDKIQISDYTREYLRSLLFDIDETLGRFNQVILRGLRTTDKPLSNLIILEFGGGAGLLSFLAIEAGAQKVIYNDIFQGSCDDATQIANACGLKLDLVICGDHKDLVKEMNAMDQKVDLILSYDVIEHVYDVSEMFKEFHRLNNPPQSLIFGSGANIRNPFYVNYVKKIQEAVEFKNREDYSGHKERDSLESYSELRKRIISNYRGDVSREDLELLASKTRGLIKSDIEKLVENYYKTNEFSYEPKHPTNTCDPLTGNWCEQLLPHKDLIRIASSYGRSAMIFKGRYTVKGMDLRGAKRLLMNAANVFLLKAGFTFAPFYILEVKPGRR